MKILFIVPYSSEGPSNRFRVEQYVPYLEKEGIGYDISPFVSREFYRILYLKGNYFKKMVFFLAGLFRRLKDLSRLHKYGLVFIHREACPIGPPFIEFLIHMFRKPMVFDFDDAIFLSNYNPANRFYSFMKFPQKTRYIIKMSKAVIVANGFLRNYAIQYNQNVHIIPTPIDTDKFRPRESFNKTPVIGWIGSSTTVSYLKSIYPVLGELSKRHKFILRVIGSGGSADIPGVVVENMEWSLEKEVRDFQGIDIGIYPLPDTEWARGKAAFKAIQYMATGVPVVASSVGMAKEVIKDSVDGFLVSSNMEWCDKIKRLLDDAELRRKMGIAGREKVINKHLLESKRDNARR